MPPSPVVGRSWGGGSYLAVPWAARCDGRGCAAGLVFAGRHQRLPGTETAGTWRWGRDPACDPPAAVRFQHPRERVQVKEEVYPSGGLSVQTPVHAELYQTSSGPAGCLGGQDSAWGGEACSQLRSGPWEHGRLTAASPSGTCTDPPRAALGAALLSWGIISPDPTSQGRSGAAALSPPQAWSSGCTGLGSAVRGHPTPPSLGWEIL